MRHMFQVVTKGEVVQLEMSPEELDLAIRVTNYFKNDVDDVSDFYAITTASREDLAKLAERLEGAARSDDTQLSLSLDAEEFSAFEYVFLHGNRFLYDYDIKGFEGKHDAIEAITDVMFPPRT